jgi:hypothetical protein
VTITISKEAFISKVISDDLLMPYGLWRLMQLQIVPEEREEVFRLVHASGDLGGVRRVRQAHR